MVSPPATGGLLEFLPPAGARTLMEAAMIAKAFGIVICACGYFASVAAISLGVAGTVALFAGAGFVLTGGAALGLAVIEMTH